MALNSFKMSIDCRVYFMYFIQYFTVKNMNYIFNINNLYLLKYCNPPRTAPATKIPLFL